MRVERALAGAIAAVIVVSALILLLVPGSVADPNAEPERPSRIDINEITLEAGEVTGETATLQLDAKVTHRGGPADNVSVVFRAVDSGTEFLADQQRVEVGSITEDGERSVTAVLTVARDGGYQLEAIVYVAEERVASRGKTISNLQSLQPDYATSPIQFHQFEQSDESVPTLSYSIAGTDGDRVRLNVSAFLTNTGEETAGDLTVVLVARQGDSNIVADRTQIRIGDVRAGRTISPSGELEVPDQYNYFLVGILKRDGVILDTVRSTANLAGGQNLTVTQDTTDPIDVGDFTPDDEDDPSGAGQEPTTTPTAGGGGPGFGIGIALLALGILAALGLRRNGR